MPTEKNFKRQVRQRMATTGERYTVARSTLEQRTAAAVTPTTPRAKRRTSRETLSALLLDRGLDAPVVAKRALSVDDDGTYFRVSLDDGTTWLYREYATTSTMGNKHMRNELTLSASLRGAGLPVPNEIGSIDGSFRAGGDPAAALFEDPGGEALALYGGHRKATEADLFLSVDGAARTALWKSVGAMLARLHDLDLRYAGKLAEPEIRDRRRQSPAQVTAMFIKAIKEVEKRFPDASASARELVALRPLLREYLEGLPVAIRCGDPCFPTMLLARSGRGWSCEGWVGWGYYASVGQPSLDVAGIERHVREWSGEELPQAFYKAYGRPLDDVVMTFSRLVRQCRNIVIEWGPRHYQRGYVPPYPDVVDPAVALPIALEELRAGLSL